MTIEEKCAPYLPYKVKCYAMGEIVEGIHDEDIDYYDDFQPIPLTDELLIKSGANKFDNGFIIDRFRLIYKSAYKYYYVIDKHTNVYFSKVEFVHEWQNLFFSMNGNELKINL